MDYLKAFTAGFISTLVFHQGAMAVLYTADLWAKQPYDMKATAPFHLPAVISLALWGGLWGIALWLTMRDAPGLSYWATALLLGALGPTIVALFVVFPLKGMPLAAGWDQKIIFGALVLNGAWGLGVALLMRLLARI